MEQRKEIEVFGTLTKTEKVFTIDKKVAAGSLVFEALEPFPGYYHQTPFDTKPVYLYLALEENYPLEDVIRISQKIQPYFEKRFDAGKGFLKVVNEKYNVLRIRHLNDYDMVEQVQLSFAENGIRYLHRQKKNFEAEAYIKVVKFLNLQYLDQGIWLDMRENFHGYIELPEKLSWDEFKEVTLSVKYNWDGSKFDAAKGAFYYQGKLHEFIRVYSTKIGTDYLKELRKVYHEKLK
ncbi:MAG: hypothetical protein RBS73_16255 [Prolixibacteraceae bacterium]|jgi:hypothetical protein|nr:hypothetical protein [Prolixibacteraceae bacterium]